MCTRTNERTPGVTARCGLEAGSRRSASPTPRPRRAAPSACAAFKGTSPLRSASPRAAIGLAASPPRLWGLSPVCFATRPRQLAAEPCVAFASFHLFLVFLCVRSAPATCTQRSLYLHEQALSRIPFTPPGWRLPPHVLLGLVPPSPGPWGPLRCVFVSPPLVRCSPGDLCARRARSATLNTATLLGSSALCLIDTLISFPGRSVRACPMPVDWRDSAGRPGLRPALLWSKSSGASMSAVEFWLPGSSPDGASQPDLAGCVPLAPEFMP